MIMALENDSDLLTPIAAIVYMKNILKNNNGFYT